MKKLIRTSVFVLGLTFAGSSVMPVFALPPQQGRDQNRDRDDQNRDRDDQNRQTGDQDRNRQMGDHDQDRDHQTGDRDQHRMSNMGDEDRYRNNRYYKMGWQDGEHHKHKNRKFDNDDDRQAYEAGFMRGDRGEKWQNHPQDRDHDHDNDRH